jgi:hypothetical protein
MADNNTQTTFAKKGFWIAFFIAVLSFACPFLGKGRGIDIYSGIFSEVPYRNLNIGLAFAFFLLICIALWLPMMAYAFRRYTLQKRRYTIDQRLINYFLFAIGFSVYALPAYTYYVDSFLFEMIAWGYWLLMLCTTVMFVCYLIVQKEQLMDDDDMSKHLINND